MSGRIELPEGTDEVTGWAEVSSHWLTLERDEDGVIYLVSWFHHRPTVWAKIRPGGSVESVEVY